MKTKEEYLKSANTQIDFIKSLGLNQYQYEWLCAALYLSYLEGSRDADISTLERIESNNINREAE